MGLFLLLIMIVVPIVEIGVFIQVGGWLGLWPTLSIVILTAMLGTGLLRYQGFTTLIRAQQSLNEGRFPVAEVFDGLCLVIAGALLLTPGFVTDTFGLLLFIPQVRALVRQTVGRQFLKSGRVRMWSDGPGAPPHGPDAANGTPGDAPVIEGDFEEVDPASDKPENQDGNPWKRGDS
jgi:UPF0716 protein FxsA